MEAGDYRPAPAKAVDALRKIFARRNEEEMARGEWIYARKMPDGTRRLFKPKSPTDLR